MPKKIYDWNAIQAYYDEGHGFVACARRFKLTHYTWTKAIKNRELRANVTHLADRRRYDWVEVQAYYDAGNSYRKTAAYFGFASAAWYKAIKRGEIKTRPMGKPIKMLLLTGKSRQNIKHRLLRAGLLENRCEECGLSEWRGRPLTAHIDHINGIRNDHRLENLRMLCPNCHSQTETYSGHNVKHRRLQGRPESL